MLDMILTRILTAPLLFLFLRLVQGEQVTRDKNTCIQRSIDNKGNTNENDVFLCPTGEIYTDALSNIVNNAVIDITTDIVLSEKLVLEYFENITIVGHENVTVYIQSDGSVKFVSCKDVTIDGINWKNCGPRIKTSQPKIEFYNSSEVVIHNCSFHHIKGPAIVLSEVLGNVHIDSCTFMHNVQCEDDGVVTYYSSEAVNHTKLLLVINNCNFSFNKVTSGVLYIKGNNNFDCMAVIQNSTFVKNQGVPVYNAHNSLHLKGT